MPTEPSIIILLGITGNLARRKLLPALYQLHQDGLFDEKTIILGSSRHAADIKDVLEAAHIEGDVHDSFAKRLRMTVFEPSDPASHETLKQTLTALEAEQGTAMQRIFYLSIPPETLSGVVSTMSQTGLATPQTKIMIEKPYGHDLASAQALTKHLEAVFSEDQIYRVDHYAAKEMVQNITVFRQQNHLFNQLFSHQYVASIYVRAHENIDIEGRVDFYEQAGALRDLIQSHLLQVLADTAMLLPDQPDSGCVEFHTNRQAFLDSLVIPAPDQAVRGQYDGYRQEVNQAGSAIETFATLELTSTDPRWTGTKFILETGKALARKVSDVTVVFKATALTDKATQLVFNIDPSHHITMTAHVKEPGFHGQTKDQLLRLNIDEAFSQQRLPEAYERIFFDALRSDQTLFISAAEALRCWEIVQPLIDAWRGNDNGLVSYQKGSAGPSLQRLS